MSTTSAPIPAVVGVVYPRRGPIREVLTGFVAALKEQGVNVHGILQEIPQHLNLPPDSCGVDAIDIKTGRHVALARPTQYELDNKICSLDLSSLAEASQILRRAIDDKADVVVVEKFGKHEKDGGGLVSDLLAVMAEDIPTVVSVPEIEKEAWDKFTGGLDTTVTCDLDALTSWWNGVREQSTNTAGE